MDDVTSHEPAQSSEPTPPTAEPPGAARRRWPVAVAALVLAAGVVIAVSLSSSSTPSAAAEVAAAATGTVSSGSFDFTLHGDMSVAGQAITLSGSGSADDTQRQMAMNLTMGLPAAASSVLGGQVSLREVLDHSTLYLSSPLLADHLPDRASWVSMDLSVLRTLGGTGSTASSSDPIAALKALEQPGSGVTVTDLGPGSVGGVAVERYRADISSSALMARIEASGLSASEKAQIESSLAGTSSESVTVSVDGYHHVRQMVIIEDVGAAGQVISVSLTVDLSSWGSAQPISVPPASATVPFSQVSGSSGLSAGGAGGVTGVSGLGV
jgi:hypothetical protein